MATNVVKGAGRAKHMANARHQQRNPLPPRAASPLSPADLKARDEDRRDEVTGKKPAPSKPAAFADHAERVGWQVTRSAEGETKTVVCTRGDEKISISWVNGAFPGNERFVDDGSATHVIPGRSIRMRNASAARTAVDTPPDRVQRPKAKREPGQRGRVRSNRVANLPFDPESATDEEVLAAFQPESRVVWVNTLSGLEEEGRLTVPTMVSEISGKRVRDIGGKLKSLKIDITGEEDGAGRYVTFPTVEGGTRTVRLSALRMVR